MNEHLSTPRIPMQLSRRCLVASLQIDLDEAVLVQFREDLLHRVQETTPRGVIFDVTGLEIMDATDFEALRRTMNMVRLMGSQPVIAGLNPGIVSALMDHDADLTGVVAMMNLDDAFRHLLGAEGGPAEASEATDAVEAGTL